MVWKVTRNTVIFFLVMVVFILILLLPKEMEIHSLGGLKFEADYPFTMALYKENINEFLTYFKEEKGFGTTPGGVPFTEELVRFLLRSLKIVIPAFLLSTTIGTALGIWLFYIRNKRRGRIFSFLSWMLASIPDFFLFITVQYIFILAMNHGFPSFNLYNNEDWYSFIISCVSLTIYPLFHMVKMTAVSMENEVGEEYVRTAFAKGMNRRQVLAHIFWNAWATIVNQSHMVMLYILSSLPIIEKLSNYNGAGYQLLESIFAYESVRAVLFFIPFMLLMYLVVMVSQFARGRVMPKDVDGI